MPSGRARESPHAIMRRGMWFNIPAVLLGTAMLGTWYAKQEIVSLVVVTAKMGYFYSSACVDDNCQTIAADKIWKNLFKHDCTGYDITFVLAAVGAILTLLSSIWTGILMATTNENNYRTKCVTAYTYSCLATCCGGIAALASVLQFAVISCNGNTLSSLPGVSMGPSIMLGCFMCSCCSIVMSYSRRAKAATLTWVAVNEEEQGAPMVVMGSPTSSPQQQQQYHGGSPQQQQSPYIQEAGGSPSPSQHHPQQGLGYGGGGEHQSPQQQHQYPPPPGGQPYAPAPNSGGQPDPYGQQYTPTPYASQANQSHGGGASGGAHAQQSPPQQDNLYAPAQHGNM